MLDPGWTCPQNKDSRTFKELCMKNRPLDSKFLHNYFGNKFGCKSTLHFPYSFATIDAMQLRCSKHWASNQSYTAPNYIAEEFIHKPLVMHKLLHQTQLIFENNVMQCVIIIGPMELSSFVCVAFGCSLKVMFRRHGATCKSGHHKGYPTTDRESFGKLCCILRTSGVNTKTLYKPGKPNLPPIVFFLCGSSLLWRRKTPHVTGAVVYGFLFPMSATENLVRCPMHDHPGHATFGSLTGSA